MDNNMPKILKIPTFEYKIIDIDNEYYYYYKIKKNVLVYKTVKLTL